MPDLNAVRLFGIDAAPANKQTGNNTRLATTCLEEDHAES
nr:hypothetical protein [Kibdelosporangium sp. MJ126-NF4]CTQ88401.1 hypothetical protein [Kibdelosporangium sp. MJ126-NF4]